MTRRAIEIAGMPWLRLIAGVAVRACRDPRIVGDVVRVLWRFRRRRWMVQFPFLPIPPRDYVRWRMYTAYGDYDALPSADDVVRYARWAVHDG
ncbi:MAG: hypothetical protein NVS1B4_26070 [Gemmatimonadaceae bacterium]